MPSQVVDDRWHEFILYTRNYQAFCRQAFGAFMHHTPAAVMGGERRSNAGVRRAAAAGQTQGQAIYCGGDFSDPSFDGGVDGFADASSSNGDGGCGGG